MCRTALSFMGSVTTVLSRPAKAMEDKPWWGFLFTHPIISPVLWSSSFFLSAVVLILSTPRMVLPSISHGLLFLLLLLAIALGQGVQSFLYPKVAPLYDGGWMPSLQRTFLSNGIFIFLAFSFYLCWWSLWLGVPALLITVVYTWRYLPFQRKRKGFFVDMQEWLNAKSRTQTPGIHGVERACVIGSIFAVLLGSTAFLETMVPIWQPGYTVKILGKQVQGGGRGGPTYTVKMAGWPAEQQRMTQRVSASEYEHLRTGQTYRMVTWRGLWGTERIKQFKQLK